MSHTVSNLQMVEGTEEDTCGLHPNTSALFKVFEHVRVLVCDSGTQSNPSTHAEGNLLWEAI